MVVFSEDVFYLDVALDASERILGAPEEELRDQYVTEKGRAAPADIDNAKPEEKALVEGKSDKRAVDFAIARVLVY